MNQHLLHADNLSRAFGEFQALVPTSFTLNRGEIVAIVGANGAGKSTLLLCLSGILRPSTGNVLVEGHDLYREEVEARRRLAFVPDVPTFYTELTAWEHLQFIAMAHGVEKAAFEGQAERLLTELGLWQARHLFPQAYSRGMRLKLGLSLALIRPFSVLLLDEPTSGLDADSVVALAGKLRQLAGDGAAVLLSTHDSNFLEMLGARTWRMQEGRLAFS